MRNPRNDALGLQKKRKVHPRPLQEGLEGGLFAPADLTPLQPLLEGPGVASSSDPSSTLHTPERTCILTRSKGERGNLIRLALSPDGHVLPDVRAKAPGRGAWIGVTRAVLEQAVAKGKLKGALSRAFRTGDIRIEPDLPAQIEAALRRDALDRLGLEARASTLVTGSERIEEAARKGMLHLLYHASDASLDGNRKLAQAWRVGEGDEGSGRGGLVLSVPRTILSVALGRENVVHIGVVDGAAARRIGSAIDRWHGYMEFHAEAGAGEAVATMPPVTQSPSARGDLTDEGGSTE